MSSSKKRELKLKDKPILVLVGNPNTGKSLIFNYLSQQYVTVSNYPGTTVDITKGVGRFSGNAYLVVDTPGVNSLLPQSEDEAVSRRLIFSQEPQVILQVIDSKSLKRALYLTQELADLEIPLVLDLNMTDEARERGIKLDFRKLGEILRVKVVPTIATTREGLAVLKNSLSADLPLPNKTDYGQEIEGALAEISRLLPQGLKYKRFVSCAFLCQDKEIAKLINITTQTIQKIEQVVERLSREYPLPLKLVLQRIREKRTTQITEEVVFLQGKVLKKTWQEILSRFSLRPLTALPLTALLVYLMYIFVGKFAAGTLVDFFEKRLFGGYLIPGLEKVSALVNLPGWLHSFLLGDYGVISMALTYALAIIFPIVSAFFIFFGFLEDSGYLPRLCVLLDRLFHPLGLNGKAALPFVLGLGCDTMATLTTRTLATEKEKILATLILALAIPCSAQLGVIMGILSEISAGALFVWLTVVSFSGFAVGFIVSRILPGRRTLLIQEIPPLRIPQFSNIFLKTWLRLKWYLKEAVPLFVLGTTLLFVLDKLKVLKLLESGMSPLVTGALGLPQKTAGAFLVGFLRRDYGAAGLYVLKKSGAMNNSQALVSLVVITLFVPCIAQFFVTVKERGVKVASLILSFTFVFAFIVGTALNFIFRSLNIVF